MDKILSDPVFLLMQSIQSKPILYLGEKSLRLLHAFISGFLAGKGDWENNWYIPEWLASFNKYVIAACRMEGTDFGIVESILQNGYSESDGFDYYFYLLDCFFKEKLYLKI